MKHDRAEIQELIEVALIELKGVIQPHEVAQLRELGLDAEDTESPDALANIVQQVASLREFCEKRAKSGAAFPATLPRGRRR
jgi:hypothetical protein